jgi:hypothetical protein
MDNVDPSSQLAGPSTVGKLAGRMSGLSISKVEGHFEKSRFKRGIFAVYVTE